MRAWGACGLRKRILIGALAAVLLIVTILTVNTLRNAARWQPLVQSTAERQELLSPSWRLIKPKGQGPFHAAVLMSGCDGVHDNMDLWARNMVDLGRAALIVDSHRPRGLDRMQSWRAVCAGQVLTGAERAGDLAVAMKALAGMPDINPDGMILLGTSHGGWTIMEFLELLDSGSLPPGLADWPLPPRQLQKQIGQVVLLYPYCGVISGAGGAKWPAHIRGLMVLSDKDRIADPVKCQDMAESLATNGASIKVMTLKGADHGFDQRDHSALSPLQYVQRYVDRTTVLIDDFIRGSRAGN